MWEQFMNSAFLCIINLQKQKQRKLLYNRETAIFQFMVLFP